MATKNTQFCKPVDNGKNLEYAPVAIAPNPKPPTEAEYNAIGFFRKAIQPPTPPEGKVVSSVTYLVEDNAVVASYEYEDAPKQVRTFSKFKLFLALSQAGLWESFEEWLKGQSVLGMNAYTAFSIANDLTNENSLFLSLLAAVKKDLGVTDDQANAILAASEI